MNNYKNILPENVPPLTTYYMYLTQGCNLACRHCWIAPAYQRNGGTGGHLDYSLYKLAIEQGLPLGLNGIKFTGGEPLLHPDFVSMVDYATENQIRTWMETNGTLMTHELACHLYQKTTLNEISVSLDGATTETHEFIRNVPGSFEQAKRGIEHLVQAGYRPQVIMSIHKGNVHELEPLARWADAHGCGSMKVNLITSSGRAEKMETKDELLSVERLIEIGRWVMSDLQSQLKMKIFYSMPPALWSISSLLRLQTPTCSIKSVLGILPGGQLSMCGIGYVEPDLIYGQLGVDEVRAVWEKHPVIQSIREDLPQNMKGICGNCVHSDACIGLCSANNYHRTRDLTQSFEFCEKAYEKGLFPVSRLLDKTINSIKI